MRTTPPPMGQLDIFEHSADLMLRNDAIDALLRREPTAARAAADRLAAAYPADSQLPSIRELAESLSRRDRAETLSRHEALAEARKRLEDDIAPAASWALGSRGAVGFMQTEWRELAARCTELPFDSSRPEDHAAPLWLRAGAWAEATRAVERIESWRRIPAPLAWMLEARCRLGDIASGWPLLAELAWLAPRRLDALLRRGLPDPQLARLTRTFGASFDGSGDQEDLAWFPAWVLTQVPGLTERLSTACPSQNSPAERGMRSMIELLGLEGQGRHAASVERRRELRDLSLPLYAAYMSTR